MLKDNKQFLMKNTRYWETAAVISAAVTAAAAAGGATTSAIASHKQNKAAEEANNLQRQAQAKSEAELEKSNRSAEYQRLSALASNQSSTTYANAWGIDEGTMAKTSQKAADVSKQISQDKDETNPFFTRGLI